MSAALVVVIAAAASAAAVVATVLPSPQHRWALGFAAVAVIALLWPVQCSSSSDGPSSAVRSSCTSPVGMRLPAGVGAVAAIAVVVAVCVVVVLVRRRRAPRPPR